MNPGLGWVASRHGNETQTLPERRERRGTSLRCCLPDADDVGCPQCAHDLREVVNALRYLVRAGCPWRMLPKDLPPWSTVYQQAQRWLAAGSVEAIVHHLRMLLRLAQGRQAQPSAAIFHSGTLQSTPESGPERATMDTSARGDRRSTWPWTRSATCWRCT